MGLLFLVATDLRVIASHLACPKLCPARTWHCTKQKILRNLQQNASISSLLLPCWFACGLWDKAACALVLLVGCGERDLNLNGRCCNMKVPQQNCVFQPPAQRYKTVLLPFLVNMMKKRHANKFSCTQGEGSCCFYRQIWRWISLWDTVYLRIMLLIT